MSFQFYYLNYCSKTTCVSTANSFKKTDHFNLKIIQNFSFFREAYPEFEVQGIQLAYNITKVSRLDKER